MINRSALIVRPNAPFIDWVKSIDKSGPLPSAEQEQNVYLIPEFGNYEDLPAILKDLHEEIFEKELFAWFADESLWPAKRDFSTFLAWFRVEVHSMVDDLVGGEIVDSEAEE